MRDLAGRVITRTDTNVTVEWSEEDGWRYVTHVTLYLDDLSTVEYDQPAFAQEAPVCEPCGDNGYATDEEGLFQCCSCGRGLPQARPEEPKLPADEVPDHVQPSEPVPASLF